MGPWDPGTSPIGFDMLNNIQNKVQKCVIQIYKHLSLKRAE